MDSQLQEQRGVHRYDRTTSTRYQRDVEIATEKHKEHVHMCLWAKSAHISNLTRDQSRYTVRTDLKLQTK